MFDTWCRWMFYLFLHKIVVYRHFQIFNMASPKKLTYYWTLIVLTGAGFYTKLNVWGSLGLNFEYDGGPIIEIGGPIFLYKLQILEGSISFSEGSVLSPGQ